MKAQWRLIVDLFREKGGVLTTADFDTPLLYSQYRRALCDLRRHGFNYVAKPLTKNLWEYRLIEPVAYRVEQNGQMVFI